jgi:hypothetical protein
MIDRYRKVFGDRDAGVLVPRPRRPVGKTAAPVFDDVKESMSCQK